LAEHDGGYKLLFSHPRMVGDLLRGFIRQDWVDRLDFTSLERVSGSFVSEKLRARHADTVWKLRWSRDETTWVHVYVLLEFQSTLDRTMPLRMLDYTVLLYQHLIRHKELPASGKLPPILAAVLYNGKLPWTGPHHLRGLRETVSDGLDDWGPEMRFLLLDERNAIPFEPETSFNLVGFLFRLEASRSPEEFMGLVSQVASLLPREEEPGIRQAFTLWILHLMQRSFPGIIITEIRDLEEIPMLKRSLWEGVQENLRKAREEERQESVRRVQQTLLRQMEKRFGLLPQRVRRRVKAIASLDALEDLQVRVVAASSWEEMGLE
jgi:hypothetical protein